MITPIEELDIIEENRIFIKRDDLLGFSFGGNKARIAQAYFNDMKKQGADCIIGYGSSKSNLCRTIANMSCAKKIPCHIISASEADGTRAKSTNSDLVEQCGVAMHYCTKAQIADTVEAVMQICTKQGYHPYYINGDKYGEGNERTPLYAYENAYTEIAVQLAEANKKIDYIFLATGTGMTQAGLILGNSRAGGKEEIIGISVARGADAEREVLKRFLKSANVTESVLEKIRISDRYLCGGYGKYSSKIADTIWDVYKKYGIPLDPTYTGKAFYGMLSYLQENQIKGKNVLFLHTGGTPLFFDFLRTAMPNPQIKACTDYGKLLQYLKRIDLLLPHPLSDRVVLAEFLEKILRNGRVLTVEDKGEIASAIIFYANDRIEKNAYITLLATVPEHQGKGYAEMLMREMEKQAGACGMQRVQLDTDPVNTGAVSFYSKCGYQVAGINGKIRMVKEL